MLLTQSDEAGEHGSVNGPNPSEVSTKGNYIYHPYKGTTEPYLTINDICEYNHLHPAEKII